MTPWQQLQRYGPALVGLVLFGLSLAAIQGEIHRYGWSAIVQSLQAIPDQRRGLALGLMGINYLLLTGYDTLAIRYLQYPLAFSRTSWVGFISYAISNSVGLALLSGSALRYRFYRKWGLGNGQIAAIIAFCNASFWLGLFAVGGITFLMEPLQVPKFLRLPFASMHPVGVIFVGLTLAYLALSLATQQGLTIGRWRLPHVPFSISLAQIGVTAADWGLASAVLFVLFPPRADLSYAGFFGIYLLAQLAGIVSNVPGGLGVFETVILFILQPTFSSVEILGALLAYRLIYFWIPLGAASLSLGSYELWQYYQRRLQS
jgi:hypothetical protein